MSPQGRHFHQELESLRARLLDMSGKAEEMVRLSVQAFVNQDPVRAQEVVDRDRRIDELELEIDRQVHELLALQQPMASDLRFLTMTMQIANDLERVGDHAVNVARAVQRMAGMPPLGRTPEVVEMAELASETAGLTAKAGPSLDSPRLPGSQVRAARRTLRTRLGECQPSNCRLASWLPACMASPST